ncbi:hypothetical protein [Aeromonas hydrophila]|uniref:hypothetical protein n=1 Tax=Aeromonas hydrophila TaxID=644 RepID=UPI0022503598|nr:hypothetical protein [Aeromonas hydrophila]MCX4117193.1 hypothetical protein [Aeromonas hydrophila]
MSETDNEAGKAPRQVRGARNVREAMVEELVGDIDKLVARLDAVGDKVGKQFNVQVRSALAELQESNSEVIGGLRMTIRENEKAKEQLSMAIAEPLQMLLGLLSSTPPAIKRNWWFGFSVGIISGLSIGALCIVGLVWKFW